MRAINIINIYIYIYTKLLTSIIKLNIIINIGN